MSEMPEKQYGATRGKLLRAAARLFSESGFTKVTTREIAQASGIHVATIYSHFPSKSDILNCLYTFYSSELQKALPDLCSLLQMAETSSPHDVFMKTECHFDADIREFLDQILITAAREVNSNPESERFIREAVFAPTLEILKPLLQRLVELGKIKPLDIDTFLSVFTYYCFSAAALNYSSFGNSPERYQTDLSFMFSMITPVE